LTKGWNNSGPLHESRALQSITRSLEETVTLRLLAGKKDRG
jgi:hypothetical protein